MKINKKYVFGHVLLWLPLVLIFGLVVYATSLAMAAGIVVASLVTSAAIFGGIKLISEAK